MVKHRRNNSSEPAAIIQSPEVRVVRASAGSGKTFALAKRYVQLLLNPSEEIRPMAIREILAITFTNKAALEMKTRILEILKMTALKLLPESLEQEILVPIGLKQETASPKAFVIMEEIIRHYNFFLVETIDKFINALLSGCAFKIGLTANFQIKTNSSDYLEESLDGLIDRAARDTQVAAAFDQFLHHYLYLENRSGWFPKDDMLMIIRNLYFLFNAYGMRFRASSVDSDDIIRQKRAIHQDILRLKDSLPEGTDRRFQTAVEKFAAECHAGFDFDSVSNYFARMDFPARKGTKLNTSTKKLWEKIRSGLETLALQESCSLFNPYVRVFELVWDDFLKLAAKDDVLFLEELNTRAGHLFDEERVTVPEMYYRLAARFRHYLIDEFQDTSRLQWKNLEEMAAEALSTGGTLFYVGDQKQAIYGFRGGDARLFDEISERFSDYHVTFDNLGRNWRSHENIVAFNNAIFSRDNLCRFLSVMAEEDAKKSSSAATFREEDRECFFRIFDSARQESRGDLPGGMVRVRMIDGDKKDDREEELRGLIVSKIKELKGRFAYKDIAILVRNNQQVEDFTQWLLEEGVPVASERTSNIQEHALTKELIYLLKFLHSPIDNESFVRFILGDVFSRACGRTRDDFESFVLSLRDRIRHERDFYIYTAFRDAFPELWETYFEEFFKNVGLYPLYELMASIVHRFGCLDHFTGAQGFFMHLLEMIKRQEDETIDIESFIEEFESGEGENRYVSFPQTNAVKILTVHKSKGLEFPVCIVPCLGMDVQVGVQSSDNKQSYVLREQDGQLGLIRLKSKYYPFCDDLFQIYCAEYHRAFLNEFNNVYVALTRARMELYVYIPKKVGVSKNPVRFLVPEGQKNIGEPGSCRSQDEDGIVQERLPAGVSHDWIPYLKDEFLDESDVRARDVRRKGEKIHLALSCYGNCDRVEPDVCRQKALESLGFQFPFDSDLEDCVNEADALVRNKNLKACFFCGKAEVETEKEVVTSQGETRRIDR